MVHKQRIRLVTICLLLTATVVLCGCGEHFQENENMKDNVMDMQEVEGYEVQDIYSEIVGLTNCAPITDAERNEPEDFFKPRLGLNGRLRLKIVDVKVVSAQVQQNSSTIELALIVENYYSDGTSAQMNDWATVQLKKRNDEWIVTDVKTPT